MALPKVKHPTFKVKIPSNDKEIVMRPFTVQEEKLLLMAQESEDQSTIIDTVKQIVNNCIMDESINVSKLATFDLEYLILKIRAKSVSEIIELKYEIDGEEIPVEINLDEVEVKKNKTHRNKFMITDSLGVVMRYPSIDIVSGDNSADDLFNKITACIESVYDNDNVYDEFTQVEINEFIMSLPSESLKILGDFFNNMPKLEHTITLKKKDGEEKVITLRGLSDFFTL